MVCEPAQIIRLFERVSKARDIYITSRSESYLQHLYLHRVGGEVGHKYRSGILTPLVGVRTSIATGPRRQTLFIDLRLATHVLPKHDDLLAHVRAAAAQNIHGVYIQRHARPPKRIPHASQPVERR